MTAIQIKNEPVNDPWPVHKQVIAHVLGRNNSVDPRLGLTARNRWGLPEGIFFYGNDRTTRQPFHVDIDVTEKLDRLNGTLHVVVLGIHLMCPRCYQALYVRAPDSPGGAGRPSHPIEVHWLDRQVSTDGFWRPTFTVGGPIRCENMLKTSQRYSTEAVGFCNWRGGIVRGRCLDHRG